jgi:uncharacterized protein YndB with AHSA1/START domain
MNKSFVYVSYIRTTPAKLWDALTQPEFTRQYWMGFSHDTTWEPGAAWTLRSPDGSVADTGQVVEYDRPRRLILSWRNERVPELREEGYSRCTFELEPFGELVRLTITHEMDEPETKFLQAVSMGWPGIVSGLKTLLETGQALDVAKAFGSTS